MTLWRQTVADMHGYVPGEQPRDRRYIKLNTNENAYPPAPGVATALQAVAAESLRLYPDPVATALRQCAAATLALPGPEWVLAGNGSDDILTIAVRTFVDAGGSAAYCEPSYSLYPVLLQLQAAGQQIIELDPDFNLPADAAIQARHCSLFFIARPNAPTGTSYSLQCMHRLCREFPGVVIIDEAYADFADDNCLQFVRDYDNVVVTRTLSKGYSLAGVRLGLACAQPQLIAQMLKVKDSYNVNALTQLVAQAALQDQPYLGQTVARIRATRQWVTAELVALGLEVLPSQANFIFMKPPIAAPGFVQALREHAILVRYFSGPRTGAFVRVTIGTDAEMAEFMRVTRLLLPGQVQL